MRVESSSRLADDRERGKRHDATVIRYESRKNGIRGVFPPCFFDCLDFKVTDY